MAESIEKPNNTPDTETAILPSIEEQLRDRVAHLLEGLQENQEELADRCRDYETCMKVNSNAGAAGDQIPAGYVAPEELYRRQKETYTKFWHLHYDAERVFDIAAALSGDAAEIRSDFAGGTWRTGENGTPPSLVVDQCIKTQLYLRRLQPILSPREARTDTRNPASPDAPKRMGSPKLAQQELAKVRQEILAKYHEHTHRKNVDLYKAARVDKADFYRWLNGKLPEQSEMTKRIGAEITKSLLATPSQ